MFHIRSGGLALALAGLALVTLAAPGRALELTRSRIGSGSGYLVSGSYLLAATIGQHEAGEVRAREWTLRGGFWAGGGTVTGVDDGDDPGPPPPLVFRLYPVRPQPVRGDGVVSFDLPREDHVTAELFDVGGRRVRTLLDQRLPLGRHTARVSTHGGGPALAPGVYLLRLTTSEHTAHQRVVLLD